MAKKLKTPQDYLDFFIKDFEMDVNPQSLWIEGNNNVKILQEYKILLPRNLEIWHPYVVFIIFVYLKKYKFFGRFEKVAWEIPIKYKGIPFILAHRKFGFSIISSMESESITLAGIEAISNIHKAIPFAESLVTPQIQSLIKKGAITLDNEYVKIKNRYTFFREQAEREFKSSEKIIRKADLNPNNGLKEFTKSYNDSVKKLNAGSYYMTGMLDAYYSLLEHTLVLLLPFVKHITIANLELENFIGQTWKDKFKVIFSLTTNNEALKLFEKLDKIKEDYRNPLTHGYFQKNGHSLYVHMPHLGAIPMRLTKTNQKFKFHFDRAGQVTFQSICKCFDICDTFFQESSITKFGMRFITSGLSVAFDSKASKAYQSKMTTDKNFDEFIEYISSEQDNATNMDW